MNKINYNIKTYVFVHDQDIILHCEHIKNFNMFNNLTYVFLGSGKTDKLNEINNIIIARNLPINLEDYPKMCAYSGWYALFKNNIITSDYVNLFEYDITICDNFNDRLNSSIEDGYDFYSYRPLSVSTCFIGNPIWSEKLMEYYPNLINNLNSRCIEKSINLWSATSNVTMSKDFFYKYMTKSETLFFLIKDAQTVGHELERNLSVFQILEDDIRVKYLDIDMITHYQLDSHKTQGLIVPNYKDVIK